MAQISSSSSTLNALVDLLAKLKAEEAELRERFEGRIAALVGQIAAVQTTISLLDAEHTTTGPAARVGSPARAMLTMADWARLVDGSTHAEALRIIAMSNDGIVRVRDARRIFIGTRLAKGNPKYVSPHIHHMLRESPEFEYVKPGEFRLRQMPLHAAS